MKVVSLFSGIGGIEYGLAKSGFDSEIFCEIDPLARVILAKRFPGAKIFSDVTQMEKIPSCDILAAGFPCQDLSQAGAKKGISGEKSGLVKKLLSLVESLSEKTRPKKILIENVPYMLRLDRGRAMQFLTSELVRLGYRWAYRVVDARCFGLPQRRARVVLLASRDVDPASILFADDYASPDLDGKPSILDDAQAYGFYWTEGKRGLGWVREGVPPIKCGSTIGIASPPAVWIPARDFFGTIDIRDAERLQGFPADWTDYSSESSDSRQSYRWRLVGNAVSTKLSEWVGKRLASPSAIAIDAAPLDATKAWPDAAYGSAGGSYSARVGRWASRTKQKELSGFLKYNLKPLSQRATEGFFSRACESTNIVYAHEFIDSLNKHRNSF